MPFAYSKMFLITKIVTKVVFYSKKKEVENENKRRWKGALGRQEEVNAKQGNEQPKGVGKRSNR